VCGASGNVTGVLLAVLMLTESCNSEKRHQAGRRDPCLAALALGTPAGGEISVPPHGSRLLLRPGCAEVRVVAGAVGQPIVEVVLQKVACHRTLEGQSGSQLSPS